MYRKISGNEALVYGLVAGAKKANRELLYAGYPITPASPILEGLSALKKYGVKTLQAEDEIAAMGMAIGASFAGDLAVVATSGPGMCLKSEFIGLASITELPVIIVDVQREAQVQVFPLRPNRVTFCKACLLGMEIVPCRSSPLIPLPIVLNVPWRLLVLLSPT